MSNLFRLAGRRWLVAKPAHLAAMLITVAVLIGWLLFWGYATASGQAAASKVVVPKQPADLILLSLEGRGAIRDPVNAIEVYSYATLPVATSYGNLALGAVVGSRQEATLPQPIGDAIWVNRQLAEHWRLHTGESFTLRFREGFGFRHLSAKIAGFYEQSVFLPDVLMDGTWLRQQQLTVPREMYLLYLRTPSTDVNADNFYNLWLKQLPKTVEQVNADRFVDQARQAIDSALRPGGSATSLLFLLLTLGVGTFSLLSYLDSRRELAVLKSLGLRPGEAFALFWLESTFTAACSWVLAVFLARLLAGRLSLPLAFTAGVYCRSLFWLFLAIMLATGVPCLMGRKAGATELMYGRPVPLFCSRIIGLSRRYPALEGLSALGYRYVVLPIQDGRFDGICLRREGQPVKAGEMIAWESYAWGFGERHYLAPCDGQVLRRDLTQGLIVIEPTGK